MSAPRTVRRTRPFSTLKELGETLIYYSANGNLGYDPKDPLSFAGHSYVRGVRPSPQAEMAADREIGWLYEAATKNYGTKGSRWTLKDKARLWRAFITMARLLEFDPKSKRDPTYKAYKSLGTAVTDFLHAYSSPNEPQKEVDRLWRKLTPAQKFAAKKAINPDYFE